MRKVKKSIYTVASALMLLTASQAKLSFNVFKGVTKHFKDIHFSPIFGMTALESGLIHNIRFNMLDTPGFLDGKREYRLDKGRNPHWNMVKLLFPSVNGNLGIHVINHSNLTQYMSISNIALIMKFTNDIRQKYKELGIKPSSKNHKDISNIIDIAFKDLRKLINPSFPEEYEFKKQDSKKIDDDLKDLLKNIKLAVFDEESAADSFFPKHTTEQIISAFLCEKTNEQSELKEYIKAMDKLELARDIVDSLSGAASSSTSPLTDDISIFTIDDIPQITHRLEMLNSHLSSSSSSSSPVDIKQILDDIFHLEMSSNFSRVTPYKPETPLLNNGSALPVSGIEAQVLFDEHVFADCNETAIRHIFNLMLFDFSKQRFDLSFLETLKIKNERLKKFEEFYDFQKINNVNNGSEFVRTKWNQVVGDLNSIPNSSGHILYRNEGKNNIVSGHINTLHVFEALLGIRLTKDFQEDIIQTGKDVLEGFKLLFNIIAPDKKVALSWTGSPYPNISYPKELFGNINVSVTYQRSSYEFNIFSRPGHGEVNSLKTPKNTLATYMTLLKKAEPYLDTQTTQESLLLLDTNLKDDVQNSLYKLFSSSISDNKSRINFVQTLTTIDSDRLSRATKKLIDKALENVLNEFSWSDSYMVKTLTPHILKLLEKNQYTPVLAQTVKAIAESDHPFEKVENLFSKIAPLMALESLDTPKSKCSSPLSFTNLRHLVLYKIAYEHAFQIMRLNPNLESLDISKMTSFPDPFVIDFDMPFLKKLVLPNYLPSVIVSGNLASLESLNILEDNRFYNLTQVLFHHPTALKIVKLSENTVFTGTRNLPFVEELNLKNNIRQTDFTLDGDLLRLKRLSFPENITSLTLNGSAPELEVLIDGGEKNIKSITLRGSLPKLTHIFQDGYLFEYPLEHLSGIEHLTSVKTVNLSRTKISGEFVIGGDMPLLSSLFLPHTIQRIKISGNLLSLRFLALSTNVKKTDNTLESIEIEGYIPNLTNLTLPSSVKEIKGLEYLTGVKALDFSLSQIKNINFEHESSTVRMLLLPRTCETVERLDRLTSLSFLEVADLQNEVTLDLRNNRELYFLRVESRALKVICNSSEWEITSDLTYFTNHLRSRDVYKPEKRLCYKPDYAHIDWLDS